MTEIWNWLTQVSNDFRDWIFANRNNPMFWTMIVVVVLILFAIVYRTLHKEG